ncbi:MAG TPA: hypothetical protein VGL99_17540, partial [Chloroflexota bacterium]
AVDDRPTLVLALWGNGMAELVHGRIEQSVALFEEIRTVSIGIGSVLGIGASAFWLAQIAWVTGDRSRAISLIEETIARAEAVGDRFFRSTAVIDLGGKMLELGDYERANALFLDSLEMVHGVDNAHWTAVSLDALGWAACARGDPQLAARLMGGAEAVNDAVGAQFQVWVRASHERAITALHAALSEDAIAAAWSAGRGLSLDQLIEEARRP